MVGCAGEREREKIRAALSENYRVDERGNKQTFVCCGERKGQVCVCDKFEKKELFIIIRKRARGFCAIVVDIVCVHFYSL